VYVESQPTPYQHAARRMSAAMLVAASTIRDLSLALIPSRVTRSRPLLGPRSAQFGEYPMRAWPVAVKRAHAPAAHAVDPLAIAMPRRSSARQTLGEIVRLAGDRRERALWACASTRAAGIICRRCDGEPRARTSPESFATTGPARNLSRGYDRETRLTMGCISGKRAPQIRGGYRPCFAAGCCPG
jgi:hypothetical protein